MHNLFVVIFQKKGELDMLRNIGRRQSMYSKGKTHVKALLLAVVIGLAVLAISSGAFDEAIVAQNARGFLDSAITIFFDAINYAAPFLYVAAIVGFMAYFLYRIVKP